MKQTNSSGGADPQSKFAPIRVLIRLTPEQVETLRRDSRYIPEQPGKSSGDGGTCRRLVLEALGMPFADLHSEARAARKARFEAQGRELKPCGAASEKQRARRKDKQNGLS